MCSRNEDIDCASADILQCDCCCRVLQHSWLIYHKPWTQPYEFITERARPRELPHLSARFGCFSQQMGESNVKRQIFKSLEPLLRVQKLCRAFWELIADRSCYSCGLQQAGRQAEGNEAQLCLPNS